jgi:hypothetical protein
VKEHRLYRARRLAKDMIRGKMDEQYNKLWDYMETLRRTNVGSCVMMKVDRPLPDIPAKFKRLYLSLAAMKRGFLVGCHPIIGLDGCFLKGPHKGQLLAAIRGMQTTKCTHWHLQLLKQKSKRAGHGF